MNLRKDEQVVGRSDRDRVLVWMPGRVENFLGKVDRLHIDVILLAVLGPWHHLVLGRAHALGLERALVRLQRYIVLAIAVVDVKVVVV